MLTIISPIILLISLLFLPELTGFTFGLFASCLHYFHPSGHFSQIFCKIPAFYHPTLEPQSLLCFYQVSEVVFSAWLPGCILKPKRNFKKKAFDVCLSSWLLGNYSAGLWQCIPTHLKWHSSPLSELLFSINHPRLLHLFQVSHLIFPHDIFLHALFPPSFFSCSDFLHFPSRCPFSVLRSLKHLALISRRTGSRPLCWFLDTLFASL